MIDQMIRVPSVVGQMIKGEQGEATEGEQRNDASNSQREHGASAEGEHKKVEMVIDGEKVLASKALAEEMKRSEVASKIVTVSITILPPLTIREPASGSSALDRRFRQRESKIARGKGKGKLVERADEFHAYGDGEEFDSEQAMVIMISDNETGLIESKNKLQTSVSKSIKNTGGLYMFT
ncbi:hypothetical protein ACET3Z_000708 [Daucus carota]